MHAVRTWRIRLCLLGTLAATANCTSYHPTPRVRPSSITADVADAGIIVLGSVTSVEATNYRVHWSTESLASTLVLVKACLEAESILKGIRVPHSLCFYYYYPMGGYVGPSPNTVSKGARGFFFLVQDGDNYRSVNDVYKSHEAVQSGQHEVPRRPVKSIPEVIAETVLVPGKGYSHIYLNDLNYTIGHVGFPLIGPLATLRLLQPALSSPDADIRHGTCLAVSQAFSTEDGCLDALISEMPGTREANAARTLRVQNQSEREREQKAFLEDPTEWVDLIDRESGREHLLLWLAKFAAEKDVGLHKRACDVLRHDFPADYTRLCPEASVSGRGQ